MTTSTRQRWRAALRIAQALERQPCLPNIVLPHAAWTALERLVQRQEAAVDRGWLAIGRWLRQDVVSRLRWLAGDLETLRHELAASETPPIPTVRSLYDELAALEDEFDEVRIDLQAGTITVRTDDIVLDDVALGPFELVWHWNRLAAHSGLLVQALEPYPASSRRDVTHPHVLDETLCEGDAQEPLAQAQAAGRLTDYFLIVRQVLETYNPTSAYVALADWCGSRCASCDDRMDEDHSQTCEECGDELCDHCSRGCTQCGRTGCSECHRTCSECDESYCRRCWPRRLGPQTTLCPDCEADAECPEENPTDEITENQPAEDTVPADAPVHAAGLGQAALAAGPG